VEVALKFAGQGRIISTRLERVLYTPNDDRVMFLDLGAAQKAAELGVNVREVLHMQAIGSQEGSRLDRVALTGGNRSRSRAGGRLNASEEQTPLQESIEF
jgi:hypothetical protein